MSFRTPSSARPLFCNPFHPLHTLTPDEPSPVPSSYTDATPILSPMTSDQPDPSSPFNGELEYELDNLITLQQQLQNPNTLTVHHLSQFRSFSESSNPVSTIEETRAYRVCKRKHPSAQIVHYSRPPPLFSLHPLQTNTKVFLKHSLPSFHNILTIRPLTTTNELTLMNIVWFPHSHGLHFTTSLTH